MTPSLHQGPLPDVTAETLVHGLQLLRGSGDTQSSDCDTVVFSGGVIQAVLPIAAAKARHPKATVLDGSGFVALPGLINSHVHAAMGFFRDLGHGRDDMIETFLFPAEKSIDLRLVEPLAYGYLFDNLVHGVTTVAEHYYFVDGIAKAIDTFGMRGFVGETVADLGGAFPGKESWLRARKSIDSWQVSSRIKPVVAPHAMDTVSPELLSEVASYAKKSGLHLHMHLSQTAGERARVEKAHGMSPVALANRCGALFDKSLAVHLVSVDTADIEVLQRSGAAVGLCPASQLIYERLAPIEAFLDAGLPILLGSDCAASNDGANLLAEAKWTALFAGDRNPEQKGAPASKWLAMVFDAPYRFFFDKEPLSVGAPADISFYKIDLANLPISNLAENVLYSSLTDRATHVLIDGKFQLWHGKPTNFDLEALTEEYLAAVKAIKRRAGLS